MTAKLIASSVIALLIALFNLLLAGHSLASRRPRRDRLSFAAAPVGVCLFALAWFFSVIDPETLPAAHVLRGLGGLVSLVGFAWDAADELGGSRSRRIGLGLAQASLLAALSVFVCAWWDLPLPVVLPRALGAGLMVAILILRMRLWHSGNQADQKLSRHVVAAVAYSSLLFVALSLVAAVQGRWVTDPVLCLVLVAETLILVYIVDRRVEVDLLVSRAITYVAFSLTVAILAAIFLRELGYSVDLVLVSATVAIALLASVLFMGLSDLTTTKVASLLFPDQARLSSMLAASRGESELLKRRLERAERLAIAGELAASVAHEVKNPLAALRGYAQLLEGCSDQVGPGARAQFDKALRIIQEESDRIDARVAELLTLVRTQKPTPSRQESFELNRIVSEAVAVVEGEPLAPRIVARLEPGLALVVGNEDEIRSAVTNLLKNAVEASRSERAPIEVATELQGRRAVVEILDRGAGIPAAELDKLFRPFHTTRSGGTGLGLVIAKSAVEAAGGSIGLTPRKDGPGAVARIELDVGVSPAPAMGLREVKP